MTELATKRMSSCYVSFWGFFSPLYIYLMFLSDQTIWGSMEVKGLCMRPWHSWLRKSLSAEKRDGRTARRQTAVGAASFWEGNSCHPASLFYNVTLILGHTSVGLVKHTHTLKKKKKKIAPHPDLEPAPLPLDIINRQEKNIALYYKGFAISSNSKVDNVLN